MRTMASTVPLAEPPPPLAEEPVAEAPPPKPKRSLVWRIFKWIGLSILGFILFTLLWVLLYRFVAPPFTFTQEGDANGAAQEWMSIDRIDRNMVRAVIAAEDSKFCTHNGFDTDAIAAAMRSNAAGNRVIRGGSTISQQTAKNAFLWQGGGYFRKGLEAWFTLLMETTWPKRRIMEVYLNGHDASRLTPEEAARIAAVLPSPQRREAVDPVGFTRRYGNTIRARMAQVARDGLDRCVYE
jgi:monofunctional biosynthetic peptidoglycan transglycosylase